MFIGFDAAASEFYENGKYTFKWSDKRQFNSEEMTGFWIDWVKKYPMIISIEDSHDQNDWAGWKMITNELGRKVQLVGDDLFVTNTAILKKGIQEGVTNSILVKLNQIGTVTETLAAIRLAQTHHMTTVISHRSGETEDAFITDLAVAVNAGQIKTGSASRTDRVAKYNQLLRIEEELGDIAEYAGMDAFHR